MGAVTDLVLRQKLSRVVSEYRTPSRDAGKPCSWKLPETRCAGQYVRFVFTRGRPGVRLGPARPPRPAPLTWNVMLLLRRAVDSVLGCMPRIKEENTAPGVVLYGRNLTIPSGAFQRS